MKSEEVLKKRQKIKILLYCLITSYFLSLICFCFIPDEDEGVERVCDTLRMCIITVLNQGLRNGGGVGDILRKPSKEVTFKS